MSTPRRTRTRAPKTSAPAQPPPPTGLLLELISDVLEAIEGYGLTLGSWDTVVAASKSLHDATVPLEKEPQHISTLLPDADGRPLEDRLGRTSPSDDEIESEVKGRPHPTTPTTDEEAPHAEAETPAEPEEGDHIS